LQLASRLPVQAKSKKIWTRIRQISQTDTEKSFLKVFKIRAFRVIRKIRVPRLLLFRPIAQGENLSDREERRKVFFETSVSFVFDIQHEFLPRKREER
jgi:hypothetical protein